MKDDKVIWAERAFLKMPAQSELRKSPSEQLKELIDAETERMKRQHKEEMAKAKKTLLYVLSLVAALVIYESWVMPEIERWIINNVETPAKTREAYFSAGEMLPIGVRAPVSGMYKIEIHENISN